MRRGHILTAAGKRKSPASAYPCGASVSEDDGTRTRNHRIDSQKTTARKTQEIKANEAHLPSAWGKSPPTDPGLLRVVELWELLPEPIRRAVLALVEATVKG